MNTVGENDVEITLSFAVICDKVITVKQCNGRYNQSERRREEWGSEVNERERVCEGQQERECVCVSVWKRER